MSLLITAAAPDGIVMAADSAVTWKEAGSTIRLSNFHKITWFPRFQGAISMAGNAKIGEPPVWINNWLEQFLGDVAESRTFAGVAEEIVSALNETPGSQDDDRTFHIAGWAKLEPENPYLVPRVYTIEPKDGRYGLHSRIERQDLDQFRTWKPRSGKYPVRYFISGVPKNIAEAIKKLTLEFSRLMGITVPLPNLHSQSAYLRFLVRMVSDLYKISMKPGLVSEPVHRMLLLPSPCTSVFLPD